MSDLLNTDANDTILEIGTGSGYQTAVLSCLGNHVYSIEIIADLANKSRARLKSLGFDNVTVHHGDGYYGWSKHAPYDGIIVTAAATHIPKHFKFEKIFYNCNFITVICGVIIVTITHSDLSVNDTNCANKYNEFASCNYFKTPNAPTYHNHRLLQVRLEQNHRPLNALHHR
jgi:cyclopropane fatty-acyl-phospholipid synthase-like methyltransferase